MSISWMEYNRIMQNQFSSSWGYLDRQQPKGDPKRPLSTYFELSGSSDKPVGGKALRWNIEESKENLKDDNKVHFTASLSALETTTNNPYPSRLPSAKRPWEPLQTQLKRPITSKSYKTITFSNELEREYEKERGTKEDSLSKENRKWLTVSMGHKTTIADLVTPMHTSKGESKEEPQMRQLKSSKSQKRIHYKLDEPTTPTLKSQFSKNHYVLECSEKSSKKILDRKEEEKEKGRAHLHPNPLPSFVNKSCKLIKDDPIPFRPKIEKTTSYHGAHQAEPIERVHLKKHQTVQPSKSYHLTMDTHAPPSPTPSTPARHQKLSIHDFQIGKCKGQGAFGQVFPAIHKATRMLVALKKVPKEKVKYMLQQFVNEIKIQLFLNHPNIVSLYGFFDDASHFYIVMEYMDGGNLFGLIKKRKRLTQPEAVEKLKEVCLGLKEMHDNSILHRDIKPENIVMTNDVSKLCDFGWAAICKDRRTTYCGTLDYVSPQIIQGEGYDDSVDIWCIGVLAFELICGRPPFYNISRKETMKRICDVHYEYPCEVSPMGKAFIDRILKKNPQERIGIDEVLRHPFLTSN